MSIIFTEKRERPRVSALLFWLSCFMFTPIYRTFPVISKVYHTLASVPKVDMGRFRLPVQGQLGALCASLLIICARIVKFDDKKVEIHQIFLQ